jgi:dTDP-4-dehydrorhamnose 3,5-epimerase
MPFTFQPLDIPEVVLVEARTFGDERGFFKETFKRSTFVENGLPTEFVQDNFSRSESGVLRGLHYQLSPHAQGKLVSVLSGAIFDVAVDIRKGSPTFGHWVGVRLVAEEHKMLWVPEGFAHGFATLTGDTDVFYKVTREYAPSADRGIRWNDAALSIDWPIDEPILSEKDRDHPALADAENNFEYGGHGA